MEKLYSRINFENAPSTKTPIGATNLNKMDKAIDELDNRVIEMDTSVSSVREETEGVKQTTAKLENDMKLKANAIVIESTGNTLSATIDGHFLDLKLYGNTEQGENPTPDYPQEIRKTRITEIKTCGKNLLDMSNAKGGTSNGITVGVNDNGSYSFVGTATNAAVNVWLMGGYSSTDVLFTLPAGTYYIKDVLIYYAQKLINKVETAREGAILTLIEDTPIGGVRAVAAEVGKTYNEIHYPIIALSNVALDYEPYTESTATLSEPIELNGFNGVHDCIDKEKGVKVRRFAEVVLDGTEIWSAYPTSQSGKYRPVFTGFAENIQKPANNSRIANILCSHYIPTTAGSNGTYGANVGVSVDTGGGLYFYDETYNTSDVSLWKEWLVSNPVTLVYELAEPIETPLPDADIEALDGLKTFYGTTHISTDSEVEATMKSKAVADTKLYIDTKFAEMTLNLLNSEVE